METIVKARTKFMKKILPRHYVCEPRENGVHCYSPRGINDKSWDSVFERIKHEFKDSLIEVFCQTCTYHKRFTVYWDCVLEPTKL